MARQRNDSPDYSVLAAFGEGIVRPKVSLFYRFGLVLVAGAMLLLPLVYFALVGAAAWAVYRHAVFHWTPIMAWSGGGRLMILKFLVYVTPLLAGIVVVFFLFKPLLARRPKRAQPLALNPVDNPVLYAFIARICDIVGAPAPRRIDLDCDINASASFRRGLFSMFGHDLVLTIGLPLAANLSARELAGVVAHEFGHFTQGAGMRLSYLIRSIIAWFARVAYARDAWDESLEHWSREAAEADVRVAIVVWMVQIAVWFSRLVLKLLMFVGIIVGGFMLRQMEYDADAYEIKVAGSETFEQTMRKLATLDAAMAASARQLVATWQTKRTLPDNLPAVLRSAHETLPPPLLQKINDTLGLRRTSLFDSHPSPADRIRRARRAQDPGIFADDRPASELFANFEYPARFVTLLHYTDDLGIPITDQMLTHVDVKFSSAAAPATAAASRQTDEAEAWTFGLLPFLLPLTLDPPSPSADPAAEYGELSQVSAGLEQIAEQLRQFGPQEAELADKLASARAARLALSHGVQLAPEVLGDAGSSEARAAEIESEALQGRTDLRYSLREVLPVLKRRIQLGLSLALANGDPSSDSAPQQQPCAELVDWLNRQAQPFARWQELAEASAALDKLQAVKAAQGDCPALARVIEAQEAAMWSLAVAAGQAPDPQPAVRLRVRVGRNSPDREAIHRWLAAYHARAAEVIMIAASVQTAPCV